MCALAHQPVKKSAKTEPSKPFTGFDLTPRSLVAGSEPDLLSRDAVAPVLRSNSLRHDWPHRAPIPVGSIRQSCRRCCVDSSSLPVRKCPSNSRSLGSSGLPIPWLRSALLLGLSDHEVACLCLLFLKHRRGEFHAFAAIPNSGAQKQI